MVDSDRKLLGIFTDGDFRRRVENDLSVLSRLMSEVMTPNPSSISEDALAVELMHIFEQKKIDDVVVLDSEGRVQGLVDIQDLPSFKIM